MVDTGFSEESYRRCSTHPLRQACQRQSKIVGKRRRNFVIFRRGGVTKSVASLLKKHVYNLLFLAHKRLALLQVVRLTLDVDDGAVTQDNDILSYVLGREGAAELDDTRLYDGTIL